MTDHDDVLMSAKDRNNAITNIVGEAKILLKQASIIVPNFEKLMYAGEQTLNELRPKLSEQLESSTRLTDNAKFRLDDLKHTIELADQQLTKIGWSIDELSKTANRALSQVAVAMSFIKWGTALAIVVLLVWSILYLKQFIP